MKLSRRALLQGLGAMSALPVLAAPMFAAEAAWPSEREAGVFRCHADFSLAAYDDVLKEVGQLQDDLTEELAVAAPREEIHLFLFDRKATYLAYLQQYFPKVPARKALYIKGRGPGMVFAYRGADLPTDVRHESTHAVLHASIDNIPLWLDEGLAEYFEVPPAERVTKNPYVSAVRWNVRLGTVPDLAALEALRDLGEMGRNEYRDAWAWVHFLLHGGAEPRAALQGYLAQLAAGEEPGDFAAHLRRRVREPEAQFALHFRRWNVM